MANNPKISIIGGTIWGNRGAEAMLVTTIGLIRKKYPSADFFIFSYYSKADKKLVSDPKIEILDSSPKALIVSHLFGTLILKILDLLKIEVSNKNRFKIAQTLKHSDLLLDIGGITFSDGREKFLPFNILTIWPAMLLGTPVIKLAQAVGPFNHFLNRKLAQYFLSKCKRIYIRGKQSLQFISRLQLPQEKTVPATDIAFLFESDFSLSLENTSKLESLNHAIQNKKKNGKKIIIISPSILVDNKLQKNGKDYIKILFSAINKMGNKEFVFIFMPNSTRENSQKKHNNDILLIREMKLEAQRAEQTKSFQESLIFIDYDINTHQIRKILKNAEMMITSRYHAMISGLTLAIPTLVIGWSHKYKETMAAFGLADYVLDISQENFDLTQKIEDTLTNSKKIQKIIIKYLPSIQEQSEKQFQYISQLLA